MTTADDLTNLIRSTDNESVAACALLLLRCQDEEAALDLPEADRLWQIAKDEGISIDVAKATVRGAL